MKAQLIALGLIGLLTASVMGCNRGGEQTQPANTAHTAQHQQQQPHLPATFPNASGSYRGPNALNFALTSPLVRELPEERAYGSVEIHDAGGDRITLTVRMFADGTPCRLDAQRRGARAEVFPGQRCGARVTYDGAPVGVLVQVNEGYLEFYAVDSVRVALRGPFVGEVRLSAGIVPVEGVALWRFEGRRGY